ncbi:hypothetical protein D3C87_1911920 [compost metagenome]
MPSAFAAFCRFARISGDWSESHSTEPSTAASTCIQAAKTVPRIFCGWLKEQNTTPSTGRPWAARAAARSGARSTASRLRSFAW